MFQQGVYRHEAWWCDSNEIIHTLGEVSNETAEATNQLQHDGCSGIVS